MRRDVLRVGVGRALFELALGVTLFLAEPSGERWIGVALAITAVVLFYVLRERWSSRRQAFVAAHVAWGAAALGAVIAPWAPSARIPLLSFALGAAVEMLHADVVQRRRIHEAIRTVQWPRSVPLRRVGSVIVASAGARAMLALNQSAHLSSPRAVIPFLVALGALATLSAGFAAGPGRPHAKPIDAVLFVGLAVAIALCPTR
jgi:hypothetical protein